MTIKVLFVDRDGTLVQEPLDCQLDSVAKVRLMAGVIPALLALRDAGYRFIMVSNQDGLGTDSFPRDAFEAAHNHILQLFSSQGIEFDDCVICPHVETDNCDCRKPKTGLLSHYLARTSLDKESSAVIGDRNSDAELAEKLGLRSFLIKEGGEFEQSWAGVRYALEATARSAIIERTTRETAIRISLNLDLEQPVEINTGIGFFDHMLEQIAGHGGFSTRLICDGDLRVDEHHTVEDTAICLGMVLNRALGDKRGIQRYGFLLPMDESEARVAMDLCGRSNFIFKGKFSRASVGGLPTELVPHFFHSFADSLGAAIHIQVSGDNAHHMVEACFKAVGRTLRQAIRLEGYSMPSSKGILS